MTRRGRPARIVGRSRRTRANRVAPDSRAAVSSCRRRRAPNHRRWTTSEAARAGAPAAPDGLVLAITAIGDVMAVSSDPSRDERDAWRRGAAAATAADDAARAPWRRFCPQRALRLAARHVPGAPFGRQRKEMAHLARAQASGREAQDTARSPPPPTPPSPSSAQGSPDFRRTGSSSSSNSKHRSSFFARLAVGLELNGNNGYCGEL